jgi:hypothetical protein
MSAMPKIRASVLAASLAAVAAPAMAATTVIVATPDDDYAPVTTYYYAPATTFYDLYTPRVTEVYYEPAITVTAPRASVDRLITYDVADTLANDPRITGKIGVDTKNNVVELTGVVTTPGEARRAARDAMSVDGVKYVRNNLDTRVGRSF